MAPKIIKKTQHSRSVRFHKCNKSIRTRGIDYTNKAFYIINHFFFVLKIYTHI